MTTVVEMTLGTTLWAWLCRPCQAARIASGWAVKRHGDIAWGCDDCERVRQFAPGYVTPTVASVPTPPGARIPSASEYARPTMPETWAARLARLKKGKS